MSGRLMWVVLVIVFFSVGLTVTILAREAGVPQLIIEPLRFFLAALVCIPVAAAVWPAQMRPAWAWVASSALASTLLLLFNYFTMAR